VLLVLRPLPTYTLSFISGFYEARDLERVEVTFSLTTNSDFSAIFSTISPISYSGFTFVNCYLRFFFYCNIL